MPGCQGSFDDIKRIFEERARVNLNFNQSADIIECIAEDKAGTVQRSEQVAKQREAAPDRVCKEQCRSTCLIHTPLQCADFQMRIERYINSHQLFVPFKIEDTFL
jgi:hypothetical protein